MGNCRKSELVELVEQEKGEKLETEIHLGTYWNSFSSLGLTKMAMML